MKRILFVCHGNICRSPMAEYYFRDLTKKKGCEDLFEVESAATSTEELGSPVYPLAKRKLAEHGIGCKAKTSRRIRYEDYANFDYIIAMDSNNLRMLVPFVGEDPEHKVSLLLDHTPQSDKAHHYRDVSDPWYTRNFDAAWEDIVLGCTALLDELLALETAGQSSSAPIPESALEQQN